MKKPRDVIQPRWGVYALRKRVEKLGSVHARDQKNALGRVSACRFSFITVCVGRPGLCSSFNRRVRVRAWPLGAARSRARCLRAIKVI